MSFPTDAAPFGIGHISHPQIMVNAHLTSMQLLGTPFHNSTHQPFSFARGSEWTKITEKIRAQIPIMLNNRMTPPPRETYSLNRLVLPSH